MTEASYELVEALTEAGDAVINKLLDMYESEIDGCPVSEKTWVEKSGLVGEWSTLAYPYRQTNSSDANR